MILTPKAKDVPYKYKKITFSVDGKIVNGYYLELKSQFRLVYAMNMKNGDVGFYLYDTEQKTFQKFYNVQVETYIELIKKIKYIALGLGTLIFILFLIMISLISKNRNLRRRLKGQYKEPKKEIEIKEKLSETKKIDKVEDNSEKVDKKALKKEKKQAKLEAKAKAKEEKRLAKEAKKVNKTEEDKEEQPKPDKIEIKNSKKELKRLQKEEDKKRKKEANDFLK